MARLDAAAEKEMGPDPRAGLANDAAAKEICAVVAGEKGLRSELRSDREAAVRAAFAVARLNPAVALDALLPVAKDLCDVAEHDEIGPTEIKIFNTQIGRLSTDPVDVFKAEVRVNANGPRKARGKSRMDYGSDSDDDAPVAVSLRPSQMAGGKKKGPGAGGAPKEMTKEEIARQAQMKEEAAVRAGVRALVDRMTLRLRLTASLMRGGTRRGAAAARVPEIAAGRPPAPGFPDFAPRPRRGLRGGDGRRRRGGPRQRGDGPRLRRRPGDVRRRASTLRGVRGRLSSAPAPGLPR